MDFEERQEAVRVVAGVFSILLVVCGGGWAIYDHFTTLRDEHRWQITRDKQVAEAVDLAISWITVPYWTLKRIEYEGCNQSGEVTGYVFVTPKGFKPNDEISFSARIFDEDLWAEEPIHRREGDRIKFIKKIGLTDRIKDYLSGINPIGGYRFQDERFEVEEILDAEPFR